MARPSIYSDELAQDICRLLAQGQPMAKICMRAEMPCYATVMNWQNENKRFLELSTRAKVDGTHYMADECMVIADSADIETAEKKIRIDTRLRLAGMWNRKGYGDKTLIGSDPENPLPTGKIDLSGLSTAALAELAALEVSDATHG